jgi:hypothetical protein
MPEGKKKNKKRKIKNKNARNRGKKILPKIRTHGNHGKNQTSYK